MKKTTAWALLVLLVAAAGAAAQNVPPRQGPPAGFPDLIGGLKASPGCLGVETARTASGKQVVFAWFEDKKAVLRWFYSDAHQKAVRMGFPGYQPERQPLEGVPDNIGPIMAIASLTLAEKPKFEGTNIPFSQISIELYTPVTGGLFLGSRFAPDGLKVPKMRDYTPK